MAEEPDGLVETFEAHLRVALTVAGLVAEHAARARERAARDTEATSQQQARELRARMDAERAAARASLAPVGREEWWATAAPQDVAAAWQTARTWREVDPDARRVADRIREQVRDRHGIDVNDPRPAPGALRDALDARDAAEREAQRQRREAHREEAEAAQLLSEADRADLVEEPAVGTVAEQDARGLYGTAARRRDLAADLEGVVGNEIAEARVVADTNQACPPAAAVTVLPTSASKSRRYRGRVGRSREQQVLRGT